MSRALSPAVPGPVEQVVLSPDGGLLLGAAAGGAVFLLDREGRERWAFSRLPVERLAVCEGSPPLLCAGTWTGALRVHVPDGFAWERPVPGVVAAIAASEAAGKVVAGSWEGTVASFGLDGTPLAAHRLPDAVVRLSLPPQGGPVVAALASGRLVALDGTGPVWEADAGGPPLALAATPHETVAASPAGLLFLDAEGRVIRRLPARRRLVHAAVSPDGSWAACVEEPPLLRLVRTEDGSGWEMPLALAPSSLALAGDAASPVCLVPFAPGRLLALNRWQVPVEETLEGAASPPSFSRWGTEAATLGPGGRSILLHDLPAIRRWLPPPRLALRVGAGGLVAGLAGTLSLSVANEGGRAARAVEVRVTGEFLRSERTLRVGDLAPGETRLARLAVEPERAGELLLAITLAFHDEPGEPVVRSWQEAVSVKAAGS